MNKEEGFALLKELASIPGTIRDDSGILMQLRYHPAEDNNLEYVEVLDDIDMHEETICEIYEYDEVSVSLSNCGNLIVVTREKAYEEIVGAYGDGEDPDPWSFEWELLSITTMTADNCEFMRKLKGGLPNG